MSTSEEEEDPIRAEADVGEDPNLEKGVCLLEQCLAWGGEQRLRLRLTIVTSPGGALYDSDSSQPQIDVADVRVRSYRCRPFSALVAGAAHLPCECRWQAGSESCGVSAQTHQRQGQEQDALFL